MRISDWSSDVCSSDLNGPKHLVKAITRADLEQLVEDLIKRTLDPCKKALQDAGLKADAIDEVVLVGRMTRMPKVRPIVKDFFGKEPHTGVKARQSAVSGTGVSVREDLGGRRLINTQHNQTNTISPH